MATDPPLSFSMPSLRSGDLTSAARRVNSLTEIKNAADGLLKGWKAFRGGELPGGNLVSYTLARIVIYVKQAKSLASLQQKDSEDHAQCASGEPAAELPLPPAWRNACSPAPDPLEAPKQHHHLPVVE